MDLGLKNKKAIVTGASKGLGFAIATIFGQEGVELTINSRDPKNLSAAGDILKKSGIQVHEIAGDVSQPDFPLRLIQQAAEKMGGIDILITNAGGPRTGKFMQLTDEDWSQAVNLSLLSHVRLIRAAIPYLSESSQGSILTITSISAKQPIPDLILSNTLRAGVLGLTKSLALELANQNIRVNSILPSWTATERAVQLIRSRAEANKSSFEEEMEKQKSAAPLGRLAEPEEFARSAVFLCSPTASYLTGVMLSVDGGSYKGLL